VGWETLGGIAVRKTAIKSRSPDFRQNRFGFCPKGTAFLRGKKAQLISRIFLKVLFFRVSERLPTGRKRRSRRIAGRISIPPQEILRVRRVTFVFLCQRKKRKEKKEREIA